MFRRYNVRPGFFFSLLIALLSSFPRLIRFDFVHVGSFLSNFFYFFCSIFLCWLIHHFFLLHRFTTAYWNKNTGKAIVSIAAGLIVIIVLTFVFNGVNIPAFSGIARDDMNTSQLWLIRFFRGLVISAFTFFVVYYFRMLFILQHSRLENERLKQESLKAQLASLREQLSPHFLFNSLNTLSTLSTDSKVKEYILKMSEVYRYVMHHQEQPAVQVKDELEFIQSYSYILESRFEEGLQIHININSENLQRKILPLALQLLVENAIKHNAVSYLKPLVVAIYDQPGGLVVENDFRPKNTLDKPSGIGLTNLTRRYRLYCNKDIIITRKDGKFKVEIPFLP